MAIWGTQRVWTKGHAKRLGRTRVPVTLSVGAPIEVQRRDNADEVNAVVRARITELLHAAQEAHPSMTGDDLRFLPARLGGTAAKPEQAAKREAAEAADRLTMRVSGARRRG